MNSFIQTLCENTLENVLKNNPDVHSDHISKLYHLLPNEDKSQRALEMLVRLYKNNAISSHHLNDSEIGNESITTPLATLARAGKRNLYSSINSIDELKNHASQFSKYSVSKSSKQETDSPIVFENDHIVVRQHKTHDACIKSAILHPQNPYFNSELKGKANWCISAESDLGKTRYKDYTNSGANPVYTVYNKNTHRKYMYVHSPNNNLLLDSELRNEDQSNNTANLYHSPHDSNHNKEGLYDLFPGVEHSPIGKHIQDFEEAKLQTSNLSDNDLFHAAINNFSQYAINNKNMDGEKFTKLAGHVLQNNDSRGISRFISQYHSHPLMNKKTFDEFLSKIRIRAYPEVMKSPHFDENSAIKILNDANKSHSAVDSEALAHHYKDVGNENVMNAFINHIASRYKYETENGAMESSVLDYLVNRNAIKPHHLDKIADALPNKVDDTHNVPNILEAQGIAQNHIPVLQKLVEKGHTNSLGDVDFPDAFIDKVINNNDKAQLRTLSFNKHLKDHQLKKMLSKDNFVSTVSKLISHKNMSTDTILSHVDSLTPEERTKLFSHKPNISEEATLKLMQKYPEFHSSLLLSTHAPTQAKIDAISNKTGDYKTIIDNNYSNLDVRAHLIDHLDKYTDDINPSKLIQHIKTQTEANEILNKFEKGPLASKEHAAFGFELSHHIMNKFNNTPSVFLRTMNNPIYDDDVKLESLDKRHNYFDNHRDVNDTINNLLSTDFGERNKRKIRSILSWKGYL